MAGQDSIVYWVNFQSVIACDKITHLDQFASKRSGCSGSERHNERQAFEV